MDNPYIDERGLHCGFDHSTNLSIIKVPAGMMTTYSIVCNNHVKSGNHVCGIHELMNIIENFYEKNSIGKEVMLEIINTICNQISTNNIQVSYDPINQKLNIV